MPMLILGDITTRAPFVSRMDRSVIILESGGSDHIRYPLLMCGLKKFQGCLRLCEIDNYIRSMHGRLWGHRL